MNTVLHLQGFWQPAAEWTGMHHRPLRVFPVESYEPFWMRLQTMVRLLRRLG